MKLLFVTCAVFVGLALGSSATAQNRINSVRVVGAADLAGFNPAEYFKPLGFPSSDTSRITAGITQIKQAYYSDGYLLCRADSFSVVGMKEPGESELAIYISAGPRLLVGRLSISGNKFLTNSSFNGDLYTKVGRPFDQSGLENDIKYILGRYNQDGFPLAAVTIDSIYVYNNRGSDSLGISLNVNEGKRVRIEAVRIEGNTETKDYVIMRALQIVPGTYYNENELTLAKQRLQKLGFFQSVGDPQIFESGDTTGLLVKVVEGNTNTFDGVIGYVPSQLGQPGYFTGMIDVSMTNLFGTGRKFRAMWHQETKLTQQLEIDYGEPYIFGLPLNAEVDFTQRQQDSTSVTRNFGLSGIFLFSDNFNANVSLNTLTTTPLLNAANYYSVYQSSVLNLGVGVMYDTRNDVYSPTRGVLYETQLQFGQKKIYGPEQLITPDTRLTSYTQHLTVGLSFFHEFIARQILAVGIHGEQVTGTELDQSDMYRLGGTNTIRGYIENQFLATKAAWTNIEYRFATGRESFFFAFVDAGYIYMQSDPLADLPSSSFSVYGYGVGAQVETGLGILKASFALGKGDSFVQGKIHFGIVNQF
ncbi:MAG: BamA/TamA family outer membrane protein [Bacteroidetes bacterium]|jgi:outer membrane protein insertion porin family|nr:BamA/TamA family outer membrane protein [Bacteroidota bacterium]MCL5034277.1 BamA/TamA family outer membrane protein [Bacteroidota bacterium]